MSDDENSQAEQPMEPVKEEPGKHIFISHYNSYTGKALLKELRNDIPERDPEAVHTFIGTIKEDEK